MRAINPLVMLTVLFATVLSMHTARSADVTTNLVARYKLNGDVTDSSGNGHDGTLATGPVSDTAGIGGCMSFSRTGQVDLPAAAFTTISNEVTLSFWYKGGSAMGSFYTYTVEGLGSSGQRLFMCHLPWSNKEIFWDAGYADGSYDRIYKAASPDQYKGQWNHIALIKNTTTGTMEIYINGALFHSGSGKTKSMAGVTSFSFGREYDGLIDDFRIYDRSLSNQEVTDIHDAYIASDTVAPATPTISLVENKGYVVEFSITASDNLNVNAVEVSRGGTVLETVSGAPASYRDTGVSPSTSYSYTIRTQDTAGNWSGASAALPVTTGTETFPGVSGKVVLKQWFKGGGIEITGLTGNPRYPDTPYTGQYLTQTDAPQNVSDDGYGCRMEGWIVPSTTGDYTLYISGDNASELWFSTDDTAAKTSRIAWVEGTHTNYMETGTYASQTSAPMYLIAGRKYYFYAIMSDDWSYDHLTVQWESSSISKQIIPSANLMAALDVAAPPAPSSLATVNLSDRLVELTWGSVSDDVCLQKYTVYRDNVLVGDSTGIESFTDITVSASTSYSYTVRAVDLDGNESVDSAALPVTTLTAPTPSSGTGLSGKYWDNKDFTGTLLNRVDANVNFSWTDGSPDPSMGANDFSVVWSGQVEALYTGQHIFTARTDDGVRVYVDGKLIINDWSPHTVRDSVSSPISLTAGQKYDVRMEYYEGIGHATAQLHWESNLHPKEIVPQSQLFTDPYAAGGDVTITSAASQAVSPAWIEGRNGADASTMTITVNGGTAFNAVRMGSTNFYGDSASAGGLSLGIELDPVNATTVVAASNSDSDTVNITWTPTDLTSSGTISIRKGSKLLLTATGTGTTMSIDGNGDSTVDYTGAPGDKTAYLYDTAGTFTATASIDSVQVGTVSVHVVDYTGVAKVGNIQGVARTKDLVVTPAGQTVTAWQPPDASNNLTSAVITDGARVVTNPPDIGSGTFYLRLGGSDGPVIVPFTTQTFTLVFSTKNYFPVLKRYTDGTSLLGSTVTMSPYFSGYEIQLNIITAGTLFEETGLTTYWPPTSSFDQNSQFNVYLISDVTLNACHKTGAVREEGE